MAARESLLLRGLRHVGFEPARGRLYLGEPAAPLHAQLLAEDVGAARPQLLVAGFGHRLLARDHLLVWRHRLQGLVVHVFRGGPRRLGDVQLLIVLCAVLVLLDVLQPVIVLVVLEGTQPVAPALLLVALSVELLEYHRLAVHLRRRLGLVLLRGRLPDVGLAALFCWLALPDCLELKVVAEVALRGPVLGSLRRLAE